MLRSIVEKEGLSSHNRKGGVWLRAASASLLSTVWSIHFWTRKILTPSGVLQKYAGQPPCSRVLRVFPFCACVCACLAGKLAGGLAGWWAWLAGWLAG